MLIDPKAFDDEPCTGARGSVIRPSSRAGPEAGTRVIMNRVPGVARITLLE